MADNQKEALFGGLPESTFNQAVAFLQGIAGGGSAPEVAAAVSVLVSLAQSEHAAAASTFQVRPIDAVFKALEIKELLDALKPLSGSALITGLGSLKGTLDNLTDFWYGK